MRLYTHRHHGVGIKILEDIKVAYELKIVGWGVVAHANAPFEREIYTCCTVQIQS